MHSLQGRHSRDMPQISAGILMFRLRDKLIEVFLVHPGGPFWAGRDTGAWSIPKGLPEPDEDMLAAAKREFEEETGYKVLGHFHKLSPVKTKSGKIIHAWAVEGDCDPSIIKSTTFLMEWPPRSGRQREFPEIDRAAWFKINDAKNKINQGQRPLLDELQSILSESG
jgi:predicted NUDIX family NTP pyrophosphohydrolase